MTRGEGLDYCECGHLVSEHFELDGMGVPFQAMCQGLVMGPELPVRCRCVRLTVAL